MTIYRPGQPRRHRRALRVLRTRFLFWCLFFVPAAGAVLAWNSGYPGGAGLAGVAAVIGLAWFVSVWRETER